MEKKTYSRCSQIISPRLVIKLTMENLIYRRWAMQDSLTQLLNRRGFEEFYQNVFAGLLRYQHPVCVAMIDLDHFKKINDTFGHLMGDKVLKTVAATLKGSIRANDLVARYGGEEFIAVLDLAPTAGGQVSQEEVNQRAVSVLERIREKVARNEILFEKQKINVTVSIGYKVFYPITRERILSFKEQAKLRKSLIEMADAALYRAKQSGRNCICQ